MDLSYTKLQQHLSAQVKNKEGFRFCLKVSYFNVVRREVTWYLGLVDGKEHKGEHCSAKQKWWMGKKVTVNNALKNKNQLGRDATIWQGMRSWLAMCMWAKKEPNLTEYQNWRKKSETIDYRYLVPEFDKTLSTAAEEGQRKGRAPSNAVYWGPSFSLVWRQWWFCRTCSNSSYRCAFNDAKKSDCSVLQRWSQPCKTGQGNEKEMQTNWKTNNWQLTTTTSITKNNQPVQCLWCRSEGCLVARRLFLSLKMKFP